MDVLSRFAMLVFLLSSSGAASAASRSLESNPGLAIVADQAQTSAGVQRYDRDGIEANVFTWDFSREYVASQSSSLGVRVPLHRVQPEDDKDRWGLGDLDLTYKNRLAGSRGAFHLTMGLNAGVPTGSVNKGLGSGHWELMPFVAFLQPSRPSMLHGSLSGVFSMDGDEHAPGRERVNFVSPHGNKDMAGHLGILTDLSRAQALNLAVAGTMPTTGAKLHKVYLEARPELILKSRNGIMVALQGQIPISERRWYKHGAFLYVRRSFTP